MRSIQVILVLLMAGLLMGMAKKKPAVAVRFHAEANPSDGEQFVLPVQIGNPPRAGAVSRIPTISENDIAAIFPFQAADGTAGCAFQLDRHGTFALQTLSTDQKGKYLIAFVDGRQVADLLIDRTITDGLVTIPRGMAAAEITLLEQKYPVIGKPKKK
jgi:hypothetical protein